MNSRWNPLKLSKTFSALISGKKAVFFIEFNSIIYLKLGFVLLLLDEMVNSFLGLKISDYKKKKKVRSLHLFEAPERGVKCYTETKVG